MVQWLGLGAFTVKDPGSIHGQGTKIPQATWHDQTDKQTNKQKHLRFPNYLQACVCVCMHARAGAPIGE